MEQWDPARRDEGGTSLYGSMYRRFKEVGGRVKGVLWYQGEADAQKNAAYLFHDRFVALVDAIRRDFGDPALPFYFVQLGRFAFDTINPYWNVIQEQQRLCALEIPNCGMVAAIDLELDDLIHVSTQGHIRLGKRLAALALNDLFGHDQIEAGPIFESLLPVPWRQPRLRVKLSGVNHYLISDVRLSGFSIRDSTGQRLNLIFKSHISETGDAIDLYLRAQPPLDSYLWYGYGLNPYCNVVDARDMALPAFGPIPIREIDFFSMIRALIKTGSQADIPVAMSYVPLCIDAQSG